MGLCAAWDRGPYVFDGCLRWLLGTHPSSAFHRMWTELGVILPKNPHPRRIHADRRPGRRGPLRARGPGRLEREFKRIAPEDARLIDQLVRAARRCAPLEPPWKALELMTPFEKMKTGLRYLPMLPVVAGGKICP